MARLLEKYKKEIRPEITSLFGLESIYQSPVLEKIIVNMCCPEASKKFEVLEQAMEELACITGQKPKMTRAKKSISNFKLREGVPLGCMVTLRGRMMYEFLDRLMNIVLPRIRDFRGMSGKSFDKQGNYSLGMDDQTVFPEVDLDKVKQTQGMDITIVIKNGNKERSKELLKRLGMPFKA